MKLSICTGALLITLLVTSHAIAQESGSLPRAEIKLITGISDFGTDDTSYPHLVTGTAVRIRLTRHWSIEPEFNYMRRNSNDEDFIFQPNVVYEFNKIDDRVVPYLIGGVGFIRNRSTYNDVNFITGAPVSYDTSYTAWSGNVGAGLKIFLSKNLFIAPEARLGIQPTARATVSIGYTFPVRN